MKNQEKIWYLKYSWDSVQEWAFDMKKSAEALLGFDEILRYFVSKEEPLLSNVPYEIPTNIKKGSWEIGLFEWIASIWATAYLTSFAVTAAKDWLLATWWPKDASKIFKWALSSIQWIIKIRTHRKDKNRKIEHLKFRNNNQEVGIPNQVGEYLFVPKKYLNQYTGFPEKIFTKNTKLIEKDRVLEIGCIEADGSVKDVRLTENEKHYFYEEENEESIILPELVHWAHVEVKGEITRTTENTNTIWFRYNWHVLTCKPLSKSLAYFKDKIVSLDEGHIFSKVKMTGRVDRVDTDGEHKDKKPMILFTEIEKYRNWY